MEWASAGPNEWYISELEYEWSESGRIRVTLSRNSIARVVQAVSLVSCNKTYSPLACGRSGRDSPLCQHKPLWWRSWKAAEDTLDRGSWHHGFLSTLHWPQACGTSGNLPTFTEITWSVGLFERFSPVSANTIAFSLINVIMWYSHACRQLKKKKKLIHFTARV